MSVTNFFWDGDNLLQEYDDAGANIAHYVTEPNQYGSVISQRRSGETSYFHYEAIGSTVELTDGSGNTAHILRYYAFGMVSEQTGESESVFLFVGRSGYYSDSESPLYYVRRRIYDQCLSRWHSADSQEFDDVSHNLYRYVQNNPLMFVDPSGAFLAACLLACKLHAPDAALAAACVGWCTCAAKTTGCAAFLDICLTVLPPNPKKTVEFCVVVHNSFCL